MILLCGFFFIRQIDTLWIAMWIVVWIVVWMSAGVIHSTREWASSGENRAVIHISGVLDAQKWPPDSGSCAALCRSNM